MKRTALTLLLAAACYGAGYLTQRSELSAYREELDFVNNLTPAQLLAEIDDDNGAEINRAVLHRMDPRELLGAAFDALVAEGADEDDLAAIVDDVREINQR